MDVRNVFFRFEHLWTMFNPFHVIFGKYGLDDMRIGQWYWQTPHLLSMAFKPRCNMWPQMTPRRLRNAVMVTPCLQGCLERCPGLHLEVQNVSSILASQVKVGLRGNAVSDVVTKNAGGFAKSDFVLRQSLIYHGRAWLPKATTLIFRSYVSTMSRFSEVSVNTWCLLPIQRFICARVLPWCSDR